MQISKVILPLLIGANLVLVHAATTSPQATLKVSELKIQIDKVRQNIQEEEKAW